MQQMKLGSFDLEEALAVGTTVQVMGNAVKVLYECGVESCDQPATWALKANGHELLYCEQHVPVAVKTLMGHGIALSEARQIQSRWVRQEEDVKEYSSVLIALKPSVEMAKTLALAAEGATPPEELHLSLCFLGETSDLEDRKDQLLTMLKGLASKTIPLEEVRVDGYTRFTNPPGGGDHAIALATNSAELQEFRAMLAETLEATGFSVDKTHGFTPHITLIYSPEDTPMTLQAPWEEPKTLAFDTLYVFWGDEQIALSLGEQIGEKAGGFVTIDDRVVFIGGPGQGGGGGTAATTVPKLTPEEQAIEDARKHVLNVARRADREPLSEMEQKLMSDLADRHDPKVLQRINQIYLTENKKEWAYECDQQAGAGNPKEVNGFTAYKYWSIHMSPVTTWRGEPSKKWQSILDHEIGHIALRASRTRRPWNQSYRNDSTFDRMTWYAKTDVVEGFCETYMAYIATGGQNATGRAEAAFEVVEQVLAGIP